MAAISYYLTEKRSELKVNSLKLKNFRNYQVCSVEFDPFINIFIGKNAQGKTNLLESIYFLREQCAGEDEYSGGGVSVRNDQIPPRVERQGHDTVR